MKLCRLLALPVFTLILSTANAQDLGGAALSGAVPSAAAASTPAATSSAPVGFLSNYTRLTPALSARNDFQSYTVPDAIGHNLGRIYVMPLTTFPENAEFEYIDRATLAAMESKFNSDLATALQNKAILVNAPDQADTIIQMAVTGVTAEEPGRKPRDFLPFRLVTKPIKDATMGKQQEVLVTLETKVRNVKTNQTVFESLYRASGDTMGRTGDQNLHADAKDLDPVVESWVKQTTKSINVLQTGKKGMR